MSKFFKISKLNLMQCFQCFNVDFNVAMLQFFQILSTFSNSKKLFNILILKHWTQYNDNVENENIENLLNVSVNVNVDFFNVSMLVSMFNVDLQTLFQLSIITTFYVQLLRWCSFAKNYKTKWKMEKSCGKVFNTKKLLINCWWNWNQLSVIFIYILWEAFMVLDPESVKKINNLTVIFTHLGSVLVKAPRKMLMKLSPGQFDL